MHIRACDSRYTCKTKTCVHSQKHFIRTPCHSWVFQAFLPSVQNPCATPLSDGQSDPLADPTPRKELSKKMKKLRRICCEETDRARQAGIDDLSMHQKRVPTTVGQLLTQIQDLQNKVNSLSDAREFDDPETASSSGAPRVPSRPDHSESQRNAQPRFWIAA